MNILRTISLYFHCFLLLTFNCLALIVTYCLTGLLKSLLQLIYLFVIKKKTFSIAEKCVIVSVLTELMLAMT